MVGSNMIFVFFCVMFRTFANHNINFIRTTFNCPKHKFLPHVNVDCVYDAENYDETLYFRVIVNNITNNNFTYEYQSSTSSFNYVIIPVKPNLPNINEYLSPYDNRYINKLIGIAIDGIPIFTSLNEHGNDIVQDDSFQLDSCGGSYSSIQDFGYIYNYRVMPTCLINSTNNNHRRQEYLVHKDINILLDSYDNVPEHSILGYSLKGFPIYSPYTSRKLLHQNLDFCNGKFVNNTYGYYVTPQWPYIIGCDGPGPSKYANNRSAASDDCPLGYFKHHSLCQVCPKGKYTTSRLVACNNIASLGYYSLPGSASQVKCPSGRYGSEKGLGSRNCSGSCKAGDLTLKFNRPLLTIEYRIFLSRG